VFESYVDANYPDNGTVIKSAVDWQTWVHTPGIPPIISDFTTPELNESKTLAEKYIELAGDSSPQNYEDYKTYFSGLQQVFVDTLNGRMDDVTPAILTRIDGDLNITGTLDPEVKSRWFPLGI